MGSCSDTDIDPTSPHLQSISHSTPFMLSFDNHTSLLLPENHVIPLPNPSTLPKQYVMTAT